jgi:hypothetical protein
MPYDGVVVRAVAGLRVTPCLTAEKVGVVVTRDREPTRVMFQVYETYSEYF